MPIEYTPQLFAFDSITQIIITVVCVILYVKTRELYQLSLQKGLKYFNNAMFWYIFSFLFRYLTTLFDFFGDGVYGTFERTLPGLVLVSVNMFAAFVGGAYLAYSLVWRMFEKDRIKRRHIGKTGMLYIVTALVVAADIYLMSTFKFNTPYIFFIGVIGLLLYAISMNCRLCKKNKRKCEDLNPFLALVGLGLGVYIMLFIESLLYEFLFTIHYYAWGIATVFTLAFLYYLLKLMK